jgi:hypothetical protein
MFYELKFNGKINFSKLTTRGLLGLLSSEAFTFSFCYKCFYLIFDDGAVYNSSQDQGGMDEGIQE